MLSSRSRRFAALLAGFVCAAILASGAAFAAPGDITASLAVDINQAPSPPSSDSGPSDIINVGGILFFSAIDPDHGRELWMSDGTAAGTVRLTDIRTGPPDALATGHPLVAAGSTVLFAASDGTNQDLYKVEPPYTGGPTKIQINPTGGSDPQHLSSFAGDAYFSASDGTHGAELWKSDGGTVASGGTTLVDDIDSTPGDSSFPEQLTPAGTTLFFAATDGNDGVEGRELWKTTGSGAMEVDDLTPTLGEGSDVQELTDVGGTLFFTADDLVNGRELYKSDGTTNTRLEIVPGSTSSDPQNLGALGTTAFLNADDGVHGVELWKSDGTAPQLVADINPGGDSIPEEPVAYNGKLFFDADDGVHGEELWKTDGGPLGPGHTEQVADINPGPASSNPSEGTPFDGLFWFRVTNTSPAGSELWSTDGVSLKTFDINPGPASSSPDGLVAGPGALFFTADDGTHGSELWKATIEGAAAAPPSGAPPTVAAAPKKKKCKKRKHRAAASKKKCKKKRR